jgi:hypothetical protein
MQKKISGCHQKKNKKNITSSQPRKLIFSIQPYLTQLDNICKNIIDWGAIQKDYKIWGAIKKKLGAIQKKNLTKNKWTLNKKSFAYN